MKKFFIALIGGTIVLIGGAMLVLPVPRSDCCWDLRPELARSWLPA